MKTLILSLCLIHSSLLFAQTPVSPADEKTQTLSERYLQMKTSSETYADYKVIKLSYLDKTWKSVNDSIVANRLALQKANAEIARLEGELQNLQAAWRVKEESMKEMEIAGTHISFLGIDFGKKTFITMNLIFFAVLFAFCGLLTLQLKSMARGQREKSELMNTLAHEFEEYKRKALEKQTKISRELQNERNRLMEIRKA